MLRPWPGLLTNQGASDRAISRSAFGSWLRERIDILAEKDGGLGRTFVEADGITARVLEIAIPRGAASQAQLGVLSQIIEYGKTVGVDVSVENVP